MTSNEVLNFELSAFPSEGGTCHCVPAMSSVSSAGPLTLAVCTSVPRVPKLPCLTPHCLSQHSLLLHPPTPALMLPAQPLPQVLLTLGHHLHDVSLFPASCFLHCPSCGLSSLRLLHLSAGLSREAPSLLRVQCPISSVSPVCLHWFQLQGLAYSLSVKGSLLSDMAMSEVIPYFVYFKMLVCIRMNIKFRVEFYLSI